MKTMGSCNEEDRRQRGFENYHHMTIRHQPVINSSLSWLDLRVFYVKLSKCAICHGSTPEYLTLNHVPLNRDTLLEANGIRTGVYSDGISTLLKKVRLDKRSEEVTFVGTDSIRMTASVRFEVFHGDVLVLCGSIVLCRNNVWRMECAADVVAGPGFVEGNRCPYRGQESSIEVYVAGCFSRSPIVMTKTLQLCHGKMKRAREGLLESIPEDEAIQSLDDEPSNLTAIQNKNTMALQPRHPSGEENYRVPFHGAEYLKPYYRDGETSWFNAGVRVGVGISLSICLGVGIGVGLLVRTYHGTARNFCRHFSRRVL